MVGSYLCTTSNNTGPVYGQKNNQKTNKKTTKKTTTKNNQSNNQNKKKPTCGRFLLVLHLTPVVPKPKPLACIEQVDVAFLIKDYSYGGKCYVMTYSLGFILCT